MAIRMEGETLSRQILEDLKKKITTFSHPPKIVFLRCGKDPASEIYVRIKSERAREIGIVSETKVFPETVAQAALLQEIEKLNQDSSVSGILLQLPLPKGLDSSVLLSAISPDKDVDGLHPQNLGQLVVGRPKFIPCTPHGILKLLQFYQIPIEGSHAVIIGRSQIVGTPMALLLSKENATITLCHSKTKQIEHHTREADILIACAGKPHLVRKSWVKKGAVVIDVGIHRKDGAIIGDVHPEVGEVTKALSPVPKGVGPMTIAMLLSNIVLSHG